MPLGMEPLPVLATLMGLRGADDDVVRAKLDIWTLVNVESLGGAPQQQHENMITSKDAGQVAEGWGSIHWLGILEKLWQRKLITTY